MTKARSTIFFMFLLCALAFGAYAAVCRDGAGTKFCGETCSSSGSSCSCTGACSAEELKAVLK